MPYKIFFAILLSLFVSGCGNSSKRASLASINFQLGTNFLVNGKPREALKHLRISEEYNTKDPTVHNHLGLTYFLLNDLKKSEIHFKKALSLDDNYTESRNNYARLLIEKGDYNESIRQSEISLADQTFASREKAYTNLGIAYFRLNKLKLAEENLNRSLEIRRTDCLTQNYLGRLFYQLDKLDEAAKVLDLAVMLCSSQNFDEPHYFSALTYLKKGNKEYAITRFLEVKNNYKKGKYSKKAEQAMHKLIQGKKFQ